MNPRYIFASVLMISIIGMLAVFASLDAPTTSEWTSLAPGIDYRQFTLPDPNRVFVARMDRNNQNVAIEATISQGSLGSGVEPVSGMVARANDAITNWTKAYARVQGAYPFMADDVIRTFNESGAVDRYPRTAIAVNDRYIFFIVVDGRNAYESRGMSIAELAAFTRNVLGASWGVAQDGGGSSTMVIHGEVVNSTCSSRIPFSLDLEISL